MERHPVKSQRPLRVAGFGCRQHASLESLQAALAAALAYWSDRGEQPPLDALATASDKAAQLEPMAQALGLPLILLDRPILQRQRTPTESAASRCVTGTGSLAEAAALAAAGPGAVLDVPRCIAPDRNATCAIAQGIAQGIAQEIPQEFTQGAAS